MCLYSLDLAYVLLLVLVYGKCVSQAFRYIWHKFREEWLNSCEPNSVRRK